MGSLLLALIYVCFISLGLPDSLLGSAWPVYLLVLLVLMIAMHELVMKSKRAV